MFLNKINICNKEYKIECVNKIPGEDESTLGLFDSANRTIYIKIHEQKEMVSTLLHEIQHVILYNTGLHNLVDADMEEVLCDNFANSMAEVFKNELLVDLIKENQDGKKS